MDDPETGRHRALSGSGAEPGKPFAQVATRALEWLLPPTCPGCRAQVSAPGGLCPDCWERITFLGNPQCSTCGFPFTFQVGPLGGEETLCGDCAREHPPWKRARAAFSYDDASRDLVLAFKHADRTDWAPLFAAWLERAGAELIGDADVIVPVPLHWMRLYSRRYNQAAEIARALSNRAAVPFAPQLLVRPKRSKSQGRLGRRARFLNVQGAFRVPSCQMAALEGKCVLLIDDVLTTGATVGTAAKALLSAGARQVDVLTLARVVRT